MFLMYSKTFPYKHLYYILLSNLLKKKKSIHITFLKNTRFLVYFHICKLQVFKIRKTQENKSSVQKALSQSHLAFTRKKKQDFLFFPNTGPNHDSSFRVSQWISNKNKNPSNSNLHLPGKGNNPSCFLLVITGNLSIISLFVPVKLKNINILKSCISSYPEAVCAMQVLSSVTSWLAFFKLKEEILLRDNFHYQNTRNSSLQTFLVCFLKKKQFTDQKCQIHAQIIHFLCCNK